MNRIINLILIILIHISGFSQVNEQLNENNDWDLFLDQGDTLEAIMILWSDSIDQKEKIELINNICLDSYESYVKKYNVPGYIYESLANVAYIKEDNLKEKYFLTKLIEDDYFNETAFFNMSRIFFSEENYDQGFIYLEKAFKRSVFIHYWIIEEFPEDIINDPRYVELLNVYFDEIDKKVAVLISDAFNNDFDLKSVETLKAAIELEKKTNYVSQYILFTTYCLISDIYQNLDMYDEAIIYRKKALNNVNGTKSNKRIGYENANIGNLYISKYEIKSAIKYWKHAVKIFEKIGMNTLALPFFESILEVESSHSDLPMLYLSKGDALLPTSLQSGKGLDSLKALLVLDSARISINYYKKSISDAKLKDETITLIEAYTKLGDVYYNLNIYDKAEEAYKKGINIIENTRGNLSETSKFEFLEHHSFLYNQLSFIYRETNQKEKLIYVNELKRARILVESLHSKGRSIVNDDILKNSQKLLDSNQAILYYNFPYFTNEWKISKSFFELTLIKKDTVIIIDEKDYDYMDLNGFDDLTGIYGYEDAEILARNLRKKLSDPRSKEFVGISNDFYNKLIRNSEKHFQRIEEIIISPHQFLSLVPFEALIDDDDKYLCEKFNISYIQSLAMFNYLSNSSKSNYNRKVLAVGGVNYRMYKNIDSLKINKIELFSIENNITSFYNNNLSLIDFYRNASDELSNLPYSLKEVQAFPLIFKNVKTLIGEKATEHEIKLLSKNSQLSSFEIIHFATHARSFPQYPEKSAIILSKNSIHESDGFLTSNEIKELNIKASFVNLSACETAIGKITETEGSMGLVYSFFEAGAESVASSLWNINDQSTKTFMISMYQKSMQGIGYSKAINNTKLDFINGEHGELYKHPSFWAPYVYYGR